MFSVTSSLKSKYGLLQKICSSTAMRFKATSGKFCHLLFSRINYLSGLILIYHCLSVAGTDRFSVIIKDYLVADKYRAITSLSQSFFPEVLSGSILQYLLFLLNFRNQKYMEEKTFKK